MSRRYVKYIIVFMYLFLSLYFFSLIVVINVCKTLSVCSLPARYNEEEDDSYSRVSLGAISKRVNRSVELSHSGVELCSPRSDYSRDHSRCEKQGKPKRCTPEATCRRGRTRDLKQGQAKLLVSRLPCDIESRSYFIFSVI